APAVAVLGAQIGVVETVIRLAGERQQEVGVFAGETLGTIPDVDAAFASGVLDAGTRSIRWLASGDADYAHQGIGAVADGVGPAEDFDPLDVLDRQWQIRPVHGSQAGAIHRATVDQHLQSACFADASAVIVDGALVAVGIADHHARYQAHQFRNVASAAGLDQRAVNNADTAGNRCRCLFQAGSREYFGQRLVKKQILSLREGFRG